MGKPVWCLYLSLALGLVKVTASLPLSSSGSAPEDASWEEPSPEEGPFLEGDIVTGSEVIPVIELKGSVRNLAANPRLLWPDNTLYYEFPPGQFHAELRSLVEEALKDLMEQTCVRFSRRGRETTYLKLKETGKGCNSKVGYPEKEGPLTLQVAGRKCHTLGTVQHEFLHALGLWHEHTRPDRDRFVTVLWENVRPERKSNFIKRTDGDVLELLKLPYDYGSIMHYKASSFTKHRGSYTLVPTGRNKDAVKVMGQRVGMTRGDIAKLNRLYNCTGGYYRGDDLEGKEFVLGEFHKNWHKRDSEEELDNGDKERFKILNYIEGGYDKHKVNTEIKHDFNTIEREAEKKSIVENKCVEQNGKKDDGCAENQDEADNSNKKENISNLDKENASYTNVDQNTTTENSIKSPIYDFEKESLIENSEGKMISNEGYKVNSCSSRGKRESTGANSDGVRTPDSGDNHGNGNHESFAPQKILPELLKGVLNSEKNDRPIVIQFAIYQPIVYKSSNQTETRDAADKEGDKNDKGNSKDINRGEKEEPGKVSRSNEDLGRFGVDKRGETIERNYDQESEGARQEKESPEDYNSRNQQRNDDAIDVRSSRDERLEPRVRKINYDHEIEHEYEPSRKDAETREELQQEYIPSSEEREITVSRKEYTVSPDKSRENGDQLRVSQTEYKIHPKVSQTSNTFSSNQETQRSLSADSTEELVYNVHESSNSRVLGAPKKDNIQPLSVSERMKERKSVSGKVHIPNKEINPNEDHEIGFNRDMQYQTRDKSSLRNQEDKETVEQHPQLTQTYHRDYYKPPSPTFKNGGDSTIATKEEDIAPNYHEPIMVDRISQTHGLYDHGSHSSEIDEYIVPEKSEHPIYLKNKRNGSPRSSQGIDDKDDLDIVSKSTHTYLKSSDYDLKSSDIESDPRYFPNGKVKEEAFEKTPVKNVQKVIENESKESNNREAELETPLQSKQSEMLSLSYPESKENPIVATLNTNVRKESREKPNEYKKKNARPDLVIEDDFPSELDKEIRRKKIEKNTQREIETPVTTEPKILNRDSPNSQGKLNNQLRTQTNARTTVVRKKNLSARVEPSESVEEEYLVHKPQTGKLNLNPKQALPLRTSVVTGKVK